MNNDQFRRLLALTDSSSKSTGSSSNRRDDSTPVTLGSRMRSSIPMTPRNVSGSSASIDFARQLREANAPAAKKFKSTAAPKGSKLAEGYVDRARLRDSNDEDDAAKRIKALEEMVKLGQMEPEAFEKVRDEIVGGDIKNVHLVKGLDRRLLERTRRGEDVFSEPEKTKEDKQPAEEVNIDDALDEVEAREVVPTVRTKQADDVVAGKKRTRDDILREMKEARQKVTQQVTQQQAALGSKFRKVAENLQPGTSRLEIDDKGREVLVVMDENGNIKRKVKKSKPLPEVVPTMSETKDTVRKFAKVPAPLGADVVIPDKPVTKVEPENEDIFADAGTDYDPLAGLEDSASETESDSEKKVMKKPPSSDMPPPSRPDKPRNYFNDKTSLEEPAVADPIHDPEFLSALRKAASVADRINKSDNADHDEETLRKLARRKEMLQEHDRDNDDLDLGFGSSRFEDQEDGEDNHFKLSKWNDAGNDEKDKGGQSKRKRGGKKRKGDKNSASDVLAVLERRAKT